MSEIVVCSGGVKGLLNNVKKNCTFLNGWLPLTSKGNSTSRVTPSKDSARVEGRFKARGVTKEGAYYV